MAKNRLTDYLDNEFELSEKEKKERQIAIDRLRQLKEKEKHSQKTITKKDGCTFTKHKVKKWK